MNEFSPKEIALQNGMSEQPTPKVRDMEQKSPKGRRPVLNLRDTEMTGTLRGPASPRPQPADAPAPVAPKEESSLPGSAIIEVSQ